MRIKLEKKAEEYKPVKGNELELRCIIERILSLKNSKNREG